MKPLCLEEIEKAVDGELNDKSFGDVLVVSVSTDSRFEMAAGLFVPLAGTIYDGHDFIQKAFANGAFCCLSEKELFSALPIIYVKDTKLALRKLAMYYRSLFDFKVVAITGSTGKTTTKDLIASVLSQKYRVVKTEGNFNNEIGLPLTAFNADEKTEVLVLEMGMNSFGEIHNLSEIAKPDICVITNIGVSHIERLGSREGILRAKCEIFDFMRPGGAAVLNGSDDLLLTLKDTRENITYYGMDEGSDIYASDIEHNGIESVSFTLNGKNGNYRIDVPYPGLHMVSNALCGAAAGELLDLSPKQIQDGAAGFKMSAMRMNIMTNDYNVTVINDTYNANPVSAKAALDVLRQADGRRVCVLGDMLELGDFAATMHYDIGTYAAEIGIDRIICIGENSRLTYYGAEKALKGNRAFYMETKERFIEELGSHIKGGDTVLVKASRAMGFEKITYEIMKAW